MLFYLFIFFIHLIFHSSNFMFTVSAWQHIQHDTDYSKSILIDFSRAITQYISYQNPVVEISWAVTVFLSWWSGIVHVKIIEESIRSRRKPVYRAVRITRKRKLPPSSYLKLDMHMLVTFLSTELFPCKKKVFVHALNTTSSLFRIEYTLDCSGLIILVQK